MRFFPGMRHQMTVQIARMPKRFVTVLAAVRLRVRILMASQPLGRCQCCLAYLARKAFAVLAVDLLHMLVQVDFRVELAGTFATLKGLLHL